jgi:F-type H+-transporting ATPase subunit alpha
MVAALNQKERSPLDMAEQVASIYAGTGGYLDRIKVERVPDFLQMMLERMHSEHQALLDKMNEGGKLEDDDEEALGKAIAEAIDDFGPDLDEEGNELEEGESDRIKSEEEREAPGRTSGDDGAEDEGGEDEDDEGKAAEGDEAEKEATPA